MNAIILHGRPSKAEYYGEEFPSMSNSHWLPWLQSQLIKKDIVAHTPEVPLAYEPLWERWKTEVERYDINPDTILVGHSCGGGFWVRYLSENPEVKVGKVFLIAPWIDVEQEDPNHMYDFELDPQFTQRTAQTTVYNSVEDSAEIQSSVSKLKEVVNKLQYKEFKGKGHFTRKTMPSHTFPELLEDILA